MMRYLTCVQCGESALIDEFDYQVFGSLYSACIKKERELVRSARAQEEKMKEDNK